MSAPTVVTMGYQPSGNMNLVVTLGYSMFANITPPTPPVPPITPEVRYGPALTPAERRRWFGSVDFESPITRAAKRKTKEYLQRVEFGILPPEVKEEILERVETKIEPIAEKVIEARAVRKLPLMYSDRIINAVMKEMKSEIQQVLENRRIMLEEESEEEDIVVISTFLLH
jgi:hypothetical protein